MEDRKGYIHIKEAVKQFNRTRQTFYNYINKGLVDTKKVNNKVYLKIADIEKLLSAYLPKEEQEGEEESAEGSSPVANQALIDKIEKVETSLSTTNEELQSLEDKLHEEVALIKDDLIVETKNVLYHHYNELQQAQINLINKLGSRSTNTESGKDPYGYLAAKKYQFLLGYIGFVAINLIVFGFLF